MEDVKGISMPWAPGKRRLEQARLSWEELTRDTGVTHRRHRPADRGLRLPELLASHHPRIIPEPFTPEACETYSRRTSTSTPSP